MLGMLRALSVVLLSMLGMRAAVALLGGP